MYRKTFTQRSAVDSTKPMVQLELIPHEPQSERKPASFAISLLAAIAMVFVIALLKTIAQHM